MRLAELNRSTRAPTKDRLIGKIMGGNPAFRGTPVPVHVLAELAAAGNLYGTTEGGDGPGRAKYSSSRPRGPSTCSTTLPAPTGRFPTAF